MPLHSTAALKRRGGEAVKQENVYQCRDLWWVHEKFILSERELFQA